jgi:hypothetical protein
LDYYTLLAPSTKLRSFQHTIYLSGLPKALKHVDTRWKSPSSPRTGPIFDFWSKASRRVLGEHGCSASGRHSLLEHLIPCLVEYQASNRPKSVKPYQISAGLAMGYAPRSRCFLLDFKQSSDCMDMGAHTTAMLNTFSHY